MRIALVVVAVVACGHPAPAPAPATPPPAWTIPAGWKHERIPFPLEFAPAIAHKGVEELRFPPGFLDAKSPAHWSYAFVWRTDDAAALDAPALATELTAYFRGLLGAVDGDKHRFAADQIAVTATPSLELTAHVFDAFGDAAPIELAGTARRIPCGAGAVWTFVLAPASSPVRAQLDELAASAACGQPPVP